MRGRASTLRRSYAVSLEANHHRVFGMARTEATKITTRLRFESLPVWSIGYTACTAVTSADRKGAGELGNHVELT